MIITDIDKEVLMKTDWTVLLKDHYNLESLINGIVNEGVKTGALYFVVKHYLKKRKIKLKPIEKLTIQALVDSYFLNKKMPNLTELSDSVGDPKEIVQKSKWKLEQILIKN